MKYATLSLVSLSVAMACATGAGLDEANNNGPNVVNNAGNNGNGAGTGNGNGNEGGEGGDGGEGGEGSSPMAGGAGEGPGEGGAGGTVAGNAGENTGGAPDNPFLMAGAGAGGTPMGGASGGGMAGMGMGGMDTGGAPNGGADTGGTAGTAGAGNAGMAGMAGMAGTGGGGAGGAQFTWKANRACTGCGYVFIGAGDQLQWDGAVGVAEVFEKVDAGTGTVGETFKIRVVSTQMFVRVAAGSALFADATSVTATTFEVDALCNTGTNCVAAGTCVGVKVANVANSYLAAEVAATISNLQSTKTACSDTASSWEQFDIIDQ